MQSMSDLCHLLVKVPAVRLLPVLWPDSGNAKSIEDHLRSSSLEKKASSNFVKWQVPTSQL